MPQWTNFQLLLGVWPSLLSKRRHKYNTGPAKSTPTSKNAGTRSTRPFVGDPKLLPNNSHYAGGSNVEILTMNGRDEASYYRMLMRARWMIRAGLPLPDLAFEPL
ncbi:uncharacterized protein LOC131693291 [Topomyia yanbarensis]|uniref:uncharacterized protein LOC131693291 n=1 Tax=Topomyia yanbarensis TaxID=2498891 RepID=UPI00273A764A|nr:uncharacterized protein LOC131693291 [Topomyia yanbarensis]